MLVHRCTIANLLRTRSLSTSITHIEGSSTMWDRISVLHSLSRFSFFAPVVQLCTTMLPLRTNDRLVAMRQSSRIVDAHPGAVMAPWRWSSPM